MANSKGRVGDFPSSSFCKAQVYQVTDLHKPGVDKEFLWLFRMEHSYNDS